MALVNQKLSKYVNQEKKYNIQDEKLKQAIRMIAETFAKIEIFYNNFLFKNYDFEENNRSIDNNDTVKSSDFNATQQKGLQHQKSYVNLHLNNKESEKLMFTSNNSNSSVITNDKKMNESIGDISINMSRDSLSVNSYRNAILSDYIKTLKIGNLIPINCGHNGCFNQAELELYSFYLLNSNLLN